MSAHTSGGYYVNVYDDSYDVLIILNEANVEPILSEVDEITDIVKFNAAQVNDGVLDFENSIRRYLEETDIECLDFGFRVMVLRYENEKRVS